MKPDYIYTYEKLLQAERSLALGEGDMRSRLSSAFLCFHTLMETDFPEDLKPEYRWIMSKLTAREPYYDYEGKVQVGSVARSCQSMRNKTAASIDERLLHLKDKIKDLI